MAILSGKLNQAKTFTRLGSDVATYLATSNFY